jgi:hypothetical protein
MVTHFQLPPYEYHRATRQARDIAISANSQAPDFSLRSSCAASTERLLEIIPYRTEERGGGCLPVSTTLPPLSFYEGPRILQKLRYVVVQIVE